MGIFKKAKIIVNPAANHGETAKIIPFLKSLLNKKIDYKLELTHHPKHAIEIAKHLDGYDLVVSVGGDGTAHEVANGLALSNNQQTALAILPTGSGNDFARTLKIPKNLKLAVKEILEGKPKMVDLGWVNGVYYSNSLGIGFDAKVAHLANRIKNEVKKAGITLYLIALFRILMRDFCCHQIRLTIDGNSWEEKIVTLIAANLGVSYGGGFLITPKAKNDDGLLEVCLIDELSAVQIVPRLPFVIIGKHSWMRQAHFYQAKKLKVQSETLLPAHVDGELLESQEFEIKVIPSSLKVVVPDRRQ
jgi:YegS/Rv2252/BmrU family lipid kinase